MNKTELKDGSTVKVGRKINDVELGDIQPGVTFTYRGQDAFGNHVFGPDYKNPVNVEPSGGFVGVDIPETDIDAFCEHLVKGTE